MNTKMSIESGKECSLANLLEGMNKIVIPDLQRDYCWGYDAWIKSENRFADLVSGFVDNLLETFDEHPNDNRTMGLVYGYEQPRYHIQICDGQQRLTTLYLLLGYVNIKAGGAFSAYLQCNDVGNVEPRLCYAIRETTLYFLSDLVRDGFVGDQGNPNGDMVLSLWNGSRPAWYSSEYDLDASIQNMIAALKSIDKCFLRYGKGKMWNDMMWKEFGRYLLSKIRFLYYDMGGRENGEETYVVINTTGEPLTAAENLKPILIGSIKDKTESERYAGEWESREQWLWENRGTALTTDAHALRFFVWYWQIGLLQEKSWKGKRSFALNPRELFARKPIKSHDEDGEIASVDRWEKFRRLDNVQNYFEAFKSLVNVVSKSSVLKAIYKSCVFGVLSKVEFDGSVSCFLTSDAKDVEQWQLNMVLPAIAYLVKFPDHKRFEAFIRRLRKNHFDQQRKRNSCAGDNFWGYVDWRHVIQIVEMAGTEDDVLITSTTCCQNSLKNIQHVIEWYSDYEKRYAALVDAWPEASSWGDSRVLMGDLSPIIVLGADNSIDFGRTMRCMDNLNCLCASIEQYKDSPLANPEIANWYLLYRVVSGVVGIGHQHRISWSVTGCYFTQIWDSLDSDFAYIYTDSFRRLLRADDLVRELKAEVIKGIEHFDAFKIDDNANVKQLLVAWLLAKVLVVSKTGRYISKESGGYPIAVANEVKENRYNDQVPISWGNLKCLLGYLYGRHEDWGRDNLEDDTRLDTPLFLSSRYKAGVPTRETIASVDKEVERLIGDCKKSLDT